MPRKSVFKRSSLRYYRSLVLHHDLPAGISVFLVALPLCLGISLASGAPPYAGILSGIVGGLLVSFLSGSQLGVSGPAAGLTTIVGASIVALGDYRVFALVVLLAGVFQIILGALRLGGIAHFFPSSVIKGMLAAIGIILISKQIPMALGYDKPDFWVEGFTGISGIQDISQHISNISKHIYVPVMVISIASLLLLSLGKKYLGTLIRWMPLPLLVVLGGIAMCGIIQWIDVTWALRPSQLVNIPANIWTEISGPDFSKIGSDPRIFRDAFSIALLASLETLLCVEAIDKLDPLKRKTPVNRELFAQGAGNIMCGMLGAIPITAVIVRGAANVDAGGRSRLSAFIHGLMLLLAVMFIPRILNAIPLASLAAILFMTGYNLTRPALYRQIFSLGWNQFLPFMITILVILFTDLLEGVAIGLLISIYFLVRNNFKAEYKIESHSQGSIEHLHIRLNSMVTFLNKVNLQKALYQVPPFSVLTIDGSDSRFIDYDVLEMISEFEKQAHEKHIELVLKNIERVSVSSIH